MKLTMRLPFGHMFPKSHSDAPHIPDIKHFSVFLEKKLKRLKKADLIEPLTVCSSVLGRLTS